MILVGSQRGNGRNLAQHLLKQENERVEVHELRGFVANDLHGAFNEAYAISKATRCQQYLFSLSLNPPPDATVETQVFEQAIGKVEDRLGLTGQPRAIVFHEKHGDDGNLRRDAHAIWSRIDTEEMKAVQLSHSHLKLQDVARELYLEHGWTMPRGLAVTGERDPRNFTLEEWQQAKRAGEDPREVKVAFQDAWAISDSKVAFTHALKERGYWLARGDRRGHVAIDHNGEVYAVAKWTGKKAKEVRERLGDTDTLPSVDEAKAEIARAMQAKMEEFQRQVREREERERAEAERQRQELDEKQRRQLAEQAEAEKLRTEQEELERQDRFRKGLLGLWDKLRGEHRRIAERNQHDARQAQARDTEERDRLVAQQQAEQQKLDAERSAQHAFTEATERELDQDAERYRRMKEDSAAARRTAFMERRSQPEARNEDHIHAPTREM
ncbi:relaxase [Thalassobaculum sp. OXR-137]|uniref:relaxase/mobilization nuclease domain-containing protein n=1 Tax=Thalassobaculum sp. OXR-137 TaxID=3100173 RepID=UPI002AC94638|nr:relaxase [Thalassobaculum sp. OXR-137]WPZ34535.1 relaxase [Thalassobaculum sp. OXR-137]